MSTTCFHMRLYRIQPDSIKTDKLQFIDNSKSTGTNYIILITVAIVFFSRRKLYRSNIIFFVDKVVNIVVLFTFNILHFNISELVAALMVTKSLEIFKSGC